MSTTINFASFGGIGFGSMSLAIEPNRPSVQDATELVRQLIEEHSLAFIDTADAYCMDDTEIGYAERLLAPFTKRSDVLVASKIGFKREGKKWIPCGRPDYLREACERSLKNLGVETIELCQFHTPDKDVPLAESIGEMSRLKEEGKIRNIGVCNIYDLDQLKELCAIERIVSLQNALNVMCYVAEEQDEFTAFCEANDMAIIAFAPLGGHRQPDMLPNVSEEMTAIAADEGLTVRQLALAFLNSLSPCIVSIPGSIQKSHILENLAMRNYQLPPEVKERLIALNLYQKLAGE